MRIAMLSSGYPPALGGVEHHVEQVARGLVAAGDAVTVITHRLDPQAPPRELRDGVEILRVPLTVRAPDYRYSLQMLRRLRRERGRFDLIHAHSYHTLVPVNAALCSAGPPRPGGRGPDPAQAGPPLVITPHYHGTGHTPFRALLHKPYRVVGGAALRRSAAVICVSRAEAAVLVADFPELTDRVRIVPNGSIPPRPSPKALQDSVVGPGDILTVGRIEAYKGTDVLVRALLQLPQTARLVVVGSGPAQADVREQARALGLSGRLVMLGRLSDDDLQAALCRAGVVASMSRHEAFGLCVADGITAGARVVASDIPAHRELLELAGRDVAATLVPPAVEHAVAGALTTALAAGRPLAPGTMPGWADVVRRTRAVYEDVSRPGRPAGAAQVARGRSS